MSRAKTLVTGATEMTGSHTVQLLLKRGHTVRVLAYNEDERLMRLQELGAEVLEPFNTLFEMGLAFIESFHPTLEVQDAEGNFITEWETVLAGSYATPTPVCWRTVRAWKSRVVIAERTEDPPSLNA